MSLIRVSGEEKLFFMNKRAVNFYNECDILSLNYEICIFLTLLTCSHEVEFG